ncbi:hypothetical protein NW755_001748 [Fusarium falciforme]|uniref:Uncharacterized protein n=1 Tax=Fusarium falciforme TaxID=195108 RepID=A0A9W8RGS6_9HYPO|nr:hypothetical protein NW755_001748 [Fusarium falciforme]
MVLTLGIVLLALAAFCGAKDTTPSEAQRLAVIFEKSKITDTVLTTAYDIEKNDKKFHCAACSNKLTISDLKLDVESNVDDYGHGTLRVSESEFVVDATSKVISGISCSTSYSKSHVRADLSAVLSGLMTRWIIFTTLTVLTTSNALIIPITLTFATG